MNLPKKRERVVALAFDGFPFSLARRLLSEGRMPALAGLLAEGEMVRMESVLPPVSTVAWACFQTGSNPGKAGIFGFAELTPSLELRLASSVDLRGKTIWQIASEAGKRVISLGVPATFPPGPLNGIMVSGFLAPSLEKAVWPPSMLGKISDLGYALDIDPIRARESLDYFKREALETFEGRMRTLLHLFDSEDWDLLFAHFIETDRVNHFLWKYFEDGKSDNADYFLDFYRRVDDCIAEVRRRIDPDSTTLIVLSDHGFCLTRHEVEMNFWLHSEGYLEYEEGSSPGWKTISPRSRAVALVPGRIHILREGIWDEGSVSEEGYESLRDELVSKLRNLRAPDTGEPICKRVLTREQAFHGPCGGPDIIIEPHDGYDLKAAHGKGSLFSTSPISGMHTFADAMLYISRHRLEGSTPSLVDVMPTVLDLLGLPAPADLDGRSLVSH